MPALLLLLGAEPGRVMWWLAAAAWGQVCELPDPDLSHPGDALSVAWVSPLGRRSGGRWLWVVPTADLRRVAAGAGGVGRTLQAAGFRRRDKEPGRRWKVVVFDVDATSLCRPIPGAVERTAVEGIGACDAKRADPPDRGQACGWLLDRATGEPSLQAYRAEWAPLAANGFCVLPMDRFVAESR